MTTVWEFTPDQLLTHLGEEGEYWIKHQYNDGSRHMCLHGAIRMCDLQPGDTYVIEQVAEDQGWGPSWNDDSHTDWSDVERFINEGIQITDADIEEVFGPNWQTILQLVRNIANATRQQAYAAAIIVDDGRYEDVEWLLEEWRHDHLYNMCRFHNLPLLNWVHAAGEAVRNAASVSLLGNYHIQKALGQIAEVVACRHLILKDGYTLWYKNVTAQARDLFGPLHPDDPT